MYRIFRTLNNKRVKMILNKIFSSILLILNQPISLQITHKNHKLNNKVDRINLTNPQIDNKAIRKYNHIIRSNPHKIRSRKKMIVHHQIYKNKKLKNYHKNLRLPK